jgi:adenosylcobinamide kinase/adenosylcobinamide-phosphate guanylyltransferase
MLIHRLFMSATLILGGARSGKSNHALRYAETLAQRRVFIATAQPFDVEMTERIDRHKADRGSGWSTVEAPLEINRALKAQLQGDRVCLVDCLTLWLSNLMHYGENIESEIDQLCFLIDEATEPLVFVSNEVGMGLVPETPLGRAFRDAQGRLNQRVAAVCDRVEFVAAGIPLRLKG